jgi:ATP-dependent helicase/nuclease subunit A
MTPRERAVRLFDRNFCVFAAAGSGKTSLLVERFMWAVTREGIEPEKILAITFTEKAAAEMKTRLVRECEKRKQVDLRRRIENAAVSTIHGFCARVLRENPLEAGVDPYFRILGDGESEILMKRVLDRLFEAESENDGWLNVLLEVGEENARQALREFYDQARALGGEELLFRVEDAAKDLAEQRGHLSAEAARICESPDSGLSGVSEIKLKEWARAICDWGGRKPTIGWEDARDLSQIFNQSPRRVKPIAAAIDRLDAIFDKWRALKTRQMAAPFKSEFARMFRRFSDSCDLEKRRISGYDFEDLLVLTYRLFLGEAPQKRGVRERYRKGFSAILVDEFQDTSPLQAKIIDLIRRENNLFVVGDVQQSIYGFRYAEPEVFKALANSSQGKNQEKIFLSENFRSRPEILAFANGIFSGIFSSATFEPLRAAGRFSRVDAPRVEILSVSRPKSVPMTMEQARVAEAKALARRILEWRELDASTRYGDIALLLRNTASIRFYEKELFESGIPYFVVKGRGFYEKQEILDVLNFLELMENPKQDIPLAGVLRSPFVGLSEDALFWLAHHAKKERRERALAESLGRLEKITHLAEEDRKRLKIFWDRLKRFQEEKNSLPISRVLEKFIDATNYEAKILTRRSGRQALANIRKIIEMARSFEQKGAYGIQDFIFYVKMLTEREVVEPQATVQSHGADAVMISTVHAAKGLEFPRVIVADMGTKAVRPCRDVFLADLQMGFGMKLKPLFSKESWKDDVFSATEEKIALKDAEEEDRLLYVAMTRAKERLFLSGALPEGRKAGYCWMTRLAHAMGRPEGFGEEGQIEFGGAKIKILGSVNIPKPVSPRKCFLFQERWLEKAVLGKRSLAAREISAAGITADETSYTEFRSQFNIIAKAYEEASPATVTDLLAESSADSGVAKVLTQEADFEATGFDGGEAGTGRNEYGQIYHRIMEGMVTQAGAKISIPRFAKILMRSLSPQERRMMATSVLSFWKGALGIQIRAAKKVFSELPFIYKTRYGILKGQMDLVYQDREGKWVVLDYKTNRIRPGDKAAAASEYEFQIGLYALVFRELTGEAPAKGVLYFAHIDDTFEFPFTPTRFEDTRVRMERYYRRILEREMNRSLMPANP